MVVVDREEYLEAQIVLADALNCRTQIPKHLLAEIARLSLMGTPSLYHLVVGEQSVSLECAPSLRALIANLRAQGL